MGRTVLLTGRPGVGKTTVIKQIAESLGDSAGGFYTAEIRDGRSRQGFKIVTLDGKDGVLSHLDLKGPPRVSSYGVNLKDLDEIAVVALLQAMTRGQYVVVDEIGKMELFSERFREVVLAAIEGHSMVVGTIMKARDPWVDDLKALPQVTILEVTEANRDHLAQHVLSLLDIGSATGA
jgi:nucleoside-triphosphatase